MRPYVSAFLCVLALGLLAGCERESDAFGSKDNVIEDPSGPSDPSDPSDPGNPSNPGTSSVELGSGQGDEFTPGTLELSAATIPAGGQTTVRATLVNSDGSLYTASSVIVSFTSYCAGNSLAELTTPVSSVNGLVTTTYKAKGCEGDDLIAASANVGGQSLTATATVTVDPAEVETIKFISATPSDIGLKNTGLNEASEVIFQVLDKNGAPKNGALVNFTLDTKLNDVSIDPASATSTQDGYVRTAVNAGTTPGSVSVRATYADDPSKYATSDGLVVSTGIPDQDSFSISVSTFNPEAFNWDGREVTVTAHAADRFNNPVRDGTRIYFTTEAGQIVDSCGTVQGACSVKWVSGGDRPVDGRATVFAYMNGEESFTDANGNGIFDAGDTFQDMPEAFLDANENGVYDAGEWFDDYNGNGQWDGADGLFNGLLCEHPTLCGARKGISVRDDVVIVMSTTEPIIEILPNSISMMTEQSVTATIRVQDLNGNLPAAGTTITTTTTTGTVKGSGADYTVPSSSAHGPLTLQVSLKAGDEADSGTLEVTVESPSGMAYTAVVPVVVNDPSSGPVLPNLRIGRDTGAGFVPGELAVPAAPVPAGGKANVTATLVDDNGDPYVGGSVDVFFYSDCATQSLATLTSPVTPILGIVPTTYEAKGCEGPDLITAFAVVNGAVISATGTVTVEAAEVGSLAFVSATPGNIGLKGTGLNESSTVVFRVLDKNGNPAPNKTVDFSLTSTTGGVQLDPVTATSTADGLVQTSVNSGTVPGSVSVKAVFAEDPTIYSVSDGLVVSTGIADQDSLTLALSTLNPEAFNVMGQAVTVSAYAADRYNNPVPDGTMVYFTTEGGQIESSCATANGRCAVTWTSAEPKPADGRASILAYMSGEESFIDLNSNGLFDDGDELLDGTEPFRDDDEDGVRGPVEPYVDYNENYGYDGMDGKYTGLLCEDTVRCSGQTMTYVHRGSVVVMSTSDAVVTFPDPTQHSLAAGTTGLLTIAVADGNGNHMPAGTTISVTVLGDLTVMGSNVNFVVPNTAALGPDILTVLLSAGVTPGEGAVEVKVTTPGGVVTPAFRPITIF